MPLVAYMQGAELPDLTIDWEDRNGDPVDFSTGHTFELKLGKPGQAAALTKTTGITGDDVFPNVLVAWASSGELNSLTPGPYKAILTATRTSDGKQRKLPFDFRLDKAIT
jgi:hypothetical protein